MGKYGNFIDEVVIYCKAGDGGNGAISFHREKYKPKGPPDGGDGGKGGDIIIKGDKHLRTLIHLKYKRHFYAEDGKNGWKNNCTGKSGKDCVINVPVGTIIRNKDTGAFLGEIIKDNEEIIVLKGGRGGRGNGSLKSFYYAEPGEKGEEAYIHLELRLLADIAIIGKPNAGKSTLLSRISNASPKIADYPFTTITPQIGTVQLDYYRSYVVVEVPGLIEDASKGKGLGISFLKHAIKAKAILFLIPADAPISKELNTLKRELNNFSDEFEKKKSIVAISKADLIDKNKFKEINEFAEKNGYLLISAITGYNLDTLKEAMWKLIA